MFLSEFIFLILRKIFQYFFNLRTNFSNQENISQSVLRHFQCWLTTDEGNQVILRHY